MAVHVELANIRHKNGNAKPESQQLAGWLLAIGFPDANYQTLKKPLSANVMLSLCCQSGTRVWHHDDEHHPGCLNKRIAKYLLPSKAMLQTLRSLS
jgi:hypothetical protein